MKRYMGMRRFNFILSLVFIFLAILVQSPLLGQSELYYEVYRNKNLDENPTTTEGSSIQEKDIKIIKPRLDSVLVELMNLKDENMRLRQENETLLAYSKESMKKAVVDRKNQSLSTDKETGSGGVRTSDYGGYKACIECTSYQPLFSEKITFHYTLSLNSDSFKGVFRFSYAPEFGQRETREQLVSGKYVETKDNLSFYINYIDKVRTDIRLVLSDRSYKSSFKAGPNASVLPYTKVTYFEDMTIYKCLF